MTDRLVYFTLNIESSRITRTNELLGSDGKEIFLKRCSDTWDNHWKE